MQPEAPRAFNREMYHDHPENVFYGTDDGYQDGETMRLADLLDRLVTFIKARNPKARLANRHPTASLGARSTGSRNSSTGS